MSPAENSPLADLSRWSSFGRRTRFVSAALLILTISVLIVCGQSERERQDDPDVVRINTELVQTGVMVFDAHGRFVDGLRQDQFELRVEGKPVQFTSFDRAPHP